MTVLKFKTFFFIKYASFLINKQTYILLLPWLHPFEYVSLYLQVIEEEVSVCQLKD